MFKKDFKIPKVQSEEVNQRTDNTIAKRKRTREHTMIYETLHREQKIEKDESQLKRG